MLGVILGTEISMKEKIFFLILGVLLIISSLFMLLKDYISKTEFKLNLFFLFPLSFILGFLTGLIGIGGGIFLSPILLFSGFPVKEIASITTIFNLLNSSAGFIKNAFACKVDYFLAILFGSVVGFGGFLGSYFGSFKLSSSILEKILIIIILTMGGIILWKGISI